MPSPMSPLGGHTVGLPSQSPALGSIAVGRQHHQETDTLEKPRKRRELVKKKHVQLCLSEVCAEELARLGFGPAESPSNRNFRNGFPYGQLALSPLLKPPEILTQHVGRGQHTSQEGHHLRRNTTHRTTSPRFSLAASLQANRSSMVLHLDKGSCQNDLSLLH